MPVRLRCFGTEPTGEAYDDALRQNAAVIAAQPCGRGDGELYQAKELESLGEFTGFMKSTGEQGRSRKWQMQVQQALLSWLHPPGKSCLRRRKKKRSAQKYWSARRTVPSPRQVLATNCVRASSRHDHNRGEALFGAGNVMRISVRQHSSSMKSGDPYGSRKYQLKR